MINYEHSPINWLIKKKHSQLAWAELVAVELQETMPLSLGRLMCIPISSPLVLIHGLRACPMVSPIFETSRPIVNSFCYERRNQNGTLIYISLKLIKN